jgi:hypothetical protein
MEKRHAAAWQWRPTAASGHWQAEHATGKSAFDKA